jgi:hypothetical protein
MAIEQAYYGLIHSTLAGLLADVVALSFVFTSVSRARIENTAVSLIMECLE